MVRLGQSVQDVAEKFHSNRSLVERACIEFHVPLSNGHRRAEKEARDQAEAPLRRQVADFVRQGHAVLDTAAHFRLRPSRIYDYCAMEGIVPRRYHHNLVFRVTAALINTDATYEAIGASMGVTKARVDQIAQSLLAAGVALHPARIARRRRTRNRV